MKNTVSFKTIVSLIIIAFSFTSCVQSSVYADARIFPAEYTQKSSVSGESLPEDDIFEARPAGLLDEEKERLLAAVVRLRESEKQAVMLRYFDGYSVKEVAEITGRSVGTVTKQLSRAHRRLRVLLGEA